MSTETKTKIYWAVIIASTVGAFVAAQILIKVTWPAALVAGIAFFLTRPYAKKIIFNEQDLVSRIFHNFILHSRAACLESSTGQ